MLIPTNKNYSSNLGQMTSRTALHRIHFLNIHVLGTSNLFESLMDTGLRLRVVIASSSAVYGAGLGKKPITEGFAPRPVIYYAVSKLAQELVALRYCRSFGIPVMRTCPFLLMNGNLLTMPDYSEILKYHRARGAMATAACYQRDVKPGLGVIEVSADNRVQNHIEKLIYHYAMSMGISIFEPAILNFIPRGERLDLPELIKKHSGEGQRVNVFNLDGDWLDICRHGDYEEAISEFARHRQDFYRKSGHYFAAMSALRQTEIHRMCQVWHTLN